MFQSIEDGLVQGPRLFIAGNFLSQTGGHGDTRGSHDHSNIECCGGGSSNFPSFICDGVPECLRATRENIRTGSDFIKIMGGGGVCSPTDRIDNVQFTSEEISAITTVAKNSQTYVTSHAYTPQSIRQAMENGVMGIEHGNMIDKETAELMAQKGAYLTPTLVTYTAMGDEKFAGYMPAESMEKNAEVYVAGLRGLKIAADAGVNICYGSDLLGHLGVSQLDEFTIRSKVLPPLAILRSATITPAKMMRQENFLGQIKQGFAADLLILNANPLEDISVLAQPERNLLAVIKDGRVDFHQRVKLRLKTLLKDWAFDTVKKHHEHWRKAKFDRFVAAHPDRPMPPALRTKWDRRNPKRYRNLGRPLDYVLFALRTEYIGLLQHRRELCRSKIDDSYCRLCKDRFKGRLETVYHLLHCCPALKPQRDKLHAEVYATVREIRNPHDMRRLILDKAPKLVAQFALRYFPIDQLEWTRTHMLDLLSEQADDGGDGD
ncbi:uncharacterized protein J4E88_003464 [Alternaria novae-zelandiae]|uniref:uncharacterized protein n=1 Tax=Alternaria novae-zelandiae TaxID=430562 RepID=UPI0020C1D34F|nr:uncharacterized protein J4E88_003464 [Alternaria novae-zelandiae]KAI4687871.1 hypothetical protein J4E88_003464 [Alternaria novae-zelandiae]